MHAVIVDDEPLARSELRYILEKCTSITKITETDSIEGTLKEILICKPDLLFLDIHLTDESGLDLAKLIDQIPNPPLIIFATAYDEHAVAAFELNAVDYVLKPFEEQRICQAVEKASSILQARTANALSQERRTTLPIQVDERIFLIPLNELIALETSNGITTVYTTKSKYQVTDSLTSFKKKLNDNFIQVHRSFIVNQNKIQEIQPWFNNTYQVTMINHLKIPVSRSYIKEFRKKVGL